MPTLAGFLQFIRNVMGIPTTALPDNSPSITFAYNVAMEIVNCAIAQVSCLMYSLAVYNLGGDNLINYAPDQPGSTYFQTLRGPKGFDTNAWTPGVVEGTADEGTNVGLLVPDFMKTLTMSDLINLKTPYGRQYLAIAQRYGTLWGLT